MLKNYLNPIALLAFLSHQFCLAQESLNQANLPAYDCETVFWSIENGGNIRQWNLQNGTVSGGTAILNAEGNSLSFGEIDGTPTFFTTSGTQIKKYTQSQGWSTIQTTGSNLNNGGFQQHQYMMRIGSSIQLYYMNGTTESYVADINFLLNAADIAVNSEGKAFLVVIEDGVHYVKIYDQTGLLQSIPISGAQNFTTNCGYGLFFISDVLYMATLSCSSFAPSALVPILIDGNTAQPGTPISFSCPNCFDTASCNQTTLDNQSFAESGFMLYPNPANSVITIASRDEIDAVSIFSADGRKVLTTNQNTIDISALQNGLYHIRFESGKKTSVKALLKN